MDTIFSWIAEWFAGSPLLILFWTGFLSATLLPGGSEAALLVALNQASEPLVAILLAATLGNTLGGLTNYWIGLWLPNRTSRQKNSQKAIHYIERYGVFALLFSWLPVIGDPLCLAAGWLRLKFIPCVIAIALGKALRYATMAALYYGFF
ncbi:membrane protein [Vibrio sp. qd031]|uniref:YqaA family protein n=1 Tax=Vibrio sp. qd031 TaxID=1603038 RepID=UPI000A0F7D4E|nr:YqaA family protein [Vibrio sp. qd031]ORT48858.1 membrane protein [Vibrio sp. qd031]